MPNYNIDSLRNGIEGCKRNIQVFEDAIRKEKETIQEYSFYISEILKKAKAAKEEAKEKSD